MRTIMMLLLSLSFSLVSFSYALEGFYKDVFLDAGSGMDHLTYLFAADSLGLEREIVNTKSGTLTRRIMAGEAIDSNGHLLYPDGEPRFRMIFVRGGSSELHGEQLGEIGRQRIRDFYYNGGSYAGSCAGMSFATINTVGEIRYEKEENYLHIFPGRIHYTGLHKGHVAFRIPSDSPLLQYPDVAARFHSNNRRIEYVYHNGGGYVIKDHYFYWAKGTEILATYTSPINTIHPMIYGDALLGRGGLIAYKKDSKSGRLILSGSHPESEKTGEKLFFTKAYFRYALDGVGDPEYKVTLSNNQWRYMDDNDDSKNEKIGDKQYHHFRINVPTGQKKLTVYLEGEAGFDFALYTKWNDYAFASTATRTSTLNGNIQKIEINNPKSGYRYIGVELKSTVTLTMKDWGEEYTGNTQVLNGISYKIKAQYSNVASSVAMKPSAENAGDTSEADNEVNEEESGKFSSMEKYSYVTEIRPLNSNSKNNFKIFQLQVNEGTYQLKLTTLSGEILAKTTRYFPAGKSEIQIELPSSKGRVVIGTLSGPNVNLRKRWVF